MMKRLPNNSSTLLPIRWFCTYKLKLNLVLFPRNLFLYFTYCCIKTKNDLEKREQFAAVDFWIGALSPLIDAQNCSTYQEESET